MDMIKILSLTPAQSALELAPRSALLPPRQLPRACRHSSKTHFPHAPPAGRAGGHVAAPPSLLTASTGTGFRKTTPAAPTTVKHARPARPSAIRGLFTRRALPILTG